MKGRHASMILLEWRCLVWNEGALFSTPSCKYSHVCWACGGPHREVEGCRANEFNLSMSYGLYIYCSCWTAGSYSCHSSVQYFNIYIFIDCIVSSMLYSYPYSGGVERVIRSTFCSGVNYVLLSFFSPIYSSHISWGRILSSSGARWFIHTCSWVSYWH